MATFVARRLLQSVPTLLGVTVLTFVLLHIAPGGPALALGGEKASPAQVANISRALGLDQPLYEQYWLWLGRLVHGDLGFSFIRQSQVGALIAQRLPQTLILMLTSLLLSLLIALPVGVNQAARRGSAFDTAASILVFVGWSMPTFWFGTLLIIFFAVDLHWFPVGGLQVIDVPTFDWPSRLAHLAMPAATLAIVSLGGWTRYIRGSMAEQFAQDYARTAVAKGLAPQVVLYKHLLRNALIPFITLVGLALPGLFGGAVITEQVFAYPGMGQLFWQSAVDRDYPTLLGMTVISAVLVIVGNLAADVAYAVADPRVRYE
ncbi:MAG: ABC transporter permease [Candidatus Eremiobacteraeota bacterium]|nr:ABC transporter permease [Candidatus Eremiobacteraeota bacterium]